MKQANAPQQSQFTDPPPIPSSFDIPCNPRATTLDAGVICFKANKLKQAKTIFKRVKTTAVATRHRQWLLKSRLYLTLIAIEQGKIKVATKHIKHLYFLEATFTLQQYGIYQMKYQILFKTVQQKGRKVNDKELDELSGLTFIRVASCAKQDCKDGIWKPVQQRQHSLQSDIACSINGNCVDEIGCAIAGTCKH
jgi:hypothetical protein